MIRLPASRAREKLSEIVNEVAFGNERMILQRHGRDMVAVISAEDLKRFEELEDRSDLLEMDEVLARREAPLAWGRVKSELKVR